MKPNKRVTRLVTATVWSWSVLCLFFLSIRASASIPSVKPVNRSPMQVLSPSLPPAVISQKFSERDKESADFHEEEQQVYKALRQLRDHFDPSMIQVPKHPDWSGYGREYPAIPASTRTGVR